MPKSLEPLTLRIRHHKSHSASLTASSPRRGRKSWRSHRVASLQMGRSSSENDGPSDDADVGSRNASSSDHTETPPHPQPQPPIRPPRQTADSAGQAPAAAARSAESIPSANEKTDDSGAVQKEKGWLESEQTGTQTFRGTPRKDANKSASDGAHLKRAALDSSHTCACIRARYARASSSTKRVCDARLVINDGLAHSVNLSEPAFRR